ncbi:MAG: DUF1501 domain-containing protein [Saprospiraceae bacterium]|nr:DUF1501 domain-containing protein [Saprospiraceae bacterium]
MSIDKLVKEAQMVSLTHQTRRLFLKDLTLGLGGLALGSLMGTACGRKPNAINQDILFDPMNPLSPRIPHYVAKAKSVIYIHLAGAPSQLELFDYKPELAKLDKKTCPPSLLEGKQFAFIRGVPTMLGPQANFKQRGESGAWVSDHLPHFANLADEVSFLKAVYTDQFNHAPAQLMMHTGSARFGRPSMGSWITYGLGSENSDLPGFVVLNSGGVDPDGGKHLWGSGFLPSVYQGVQCRSKGDPVLFLSDPKGINRNLRKASIKAINNINHIAHEEFQDPEILSRIAQYEMAFRMQVSVPDVMSIDKEPEYIHQMYGTKLGETSLANNLLLARKLVEKGVRYVQLYDWGWDSHGTSHNDDLEVSFVNKCRSMDKPVSALLLDLKQRGLLDETLVVWGGEFGRTPMQENRNGVPLKFAGRDHNPDAFTMWMAGGGIKKGYSHGQTDEIGYTGVEGRTSIFDIQATILNQLGFDHEQLTYQFQGRPFRLTDVHGEVIKEIIA